MSGRWHKLYQSDIDTHGYTMSLLIIIARIANPTATIRQLASITGFAKSHIQRVLSREGTEKGTEKGTPKNPEIAASHGILGQDRGQNGGQPSRARDVVSFGSLKANTTTETTRRARARELILPDWFPPTDWDRLMAHRKAKNATRSKQALDMVLRQYDLGRARGWTVTEMVDEQITRDWRALKAEWLPPKDGPASPILKEGLAMLRSTKR